MQDSFVGIVVVYFLIFAFGIYGFLSIRNMLLLMVLIFCLEYLLYCDNLFNLLLIIELILFCVIGLIFTEKLITLSLIKAAIYFFIFNVLMALILVFSCVTFLNILVLFNNSALFQFYNLVDIVGYYFLMQFNFYDLIKIILICATIIMCVLLFKLTIIPLVPWIVLVYNELPWVLLLVLITFYKLIFIIILIKIALLYFVYINGLTIILITIMLSIAIYTLYFGLLAYRQFNFKVLLAYLTISQVGYVLCSLSTLNILCWQYGLLYIIIYISQLLGVVLLLILNTVENFQYIARKFVFLRFTHLYYYCCLFIIVFSIWGIPPCLGFFSKFFIVIILFEQISYSGLIHILMVVVVSSVIYYQLLCNIFYYIKIYDKVQILEPVVFNLEVVPNILSGVSLFHISGIVIFPLSLIPLFFN